MDSRPLLECRAVRDTKQSASTLKRSFALEIFAECLVNAANRPCGYYEELFRFGDLPGLSREADRFPGPDY